MCDLPHGLSLPYASDRGVGRRSAERLAGGARQLLRDEDATAASEYAVMLGLIILAALSAIVLLGEGVRGFFGDASEDLPDGTA